MKGSDPKESSLRHEAADPDSEIARLRKELLRLEKLNRSLTRQTQRAEQERARHQEIFELLCRHGGDAIFLLSQAGKIGFVTPPVVNLLGFIPDEMQGRLLQDFCEAGDREDLEEFLASVASAHGHHLGEFSLSHRTGHRVELEIYGCASPHPQTQAIEIVAILRPVNVDEDAAASLQDLAAALVHELNQPLTAICFGAHACVRLVRAASPCSMDLVEALESVANQAERAAELVRRMRNLLAGGSPRRSMTDFNALVREALRQQGPVLGEAQIDVRLHLLEDLPLLSGDPIQIGQVISNLVQNAVEAMQAVPVESRRLTLSTLASAGEVQFTVADTGPGIAPDFFPRLFHAFHSTKPGGMGLGLALSRCIAEAHGGTLRASAPADCGAIFQLTLPLTGNQP